MSEFEAQTTIADVLAEVSYNRRTGVFTRKRTGKIAGSVDLWGHRQIRIKGRLTMAHRLAWLIVTGAWPKGRLDHRNGSADDNWFENLRLATSSENARNSRTRSDNAAGLKGASLHGCGKWQATIGGKYLGLFDTAGAAHAAYKSEAIKRYGEFARFE